MSLKRPHSPPASSDQQTFRSAPIEDRASIFIATYSPTIPAKSLQNLPDFRTATHRIAAWRKPSAQRSVLSSSTRLLETGHDDDGEKYGGKRLEKVLEDMGVEGTIVVARWYGGVMLGPVRFTHIDTCARQAVRLWKAKVAEESAAAKRQKTGDSRSKEELQRTLVERDNSIEVLRTLLEDKKRKAEEDGDTAETKPPTATPKKQINYSAMPIEALRKLEKARDATISFILKEIDRVEERKKSSHAANASDDVPKATQEPESPDQATATATAPDSASKPSDVTPTPASSDGCVEHGDHPVPTANGKPD